MTRTCTLIFVLLTALLTACGTAQPEGSSSEARGTVQMALTASAGSNVYRLNPAVFTIAGPENTVLDGSAVDVLEHSLPVGNYTIQLNAGWAMQKLLLGSFQPTDAELLSPSTQMFTITEFAVTRVSFQFKVGDAVITVGQGDLEVSIGVTTTFLGPRTNVAPAELTGWTQCYTDRYDNATTALAEIKMACPGSQLMLACRQVGAPALALAAHGPRAAVLRDTGANADVVSRANGVDWYYNDSWSWGFAAEGAVINKFTCDIGDLGSVPPDDNRLCFHTSGGKISGGYRCGAATDLNLASDWERVLYTATF